MDRECALAPPVDPFLLLSTRSGLLTLPVTVSPPNIQMKQVEEVDKFLLELLEDFVSQGHLQELLSLKDQLSDIAAEKPNLTVDRDDILVHFKPFEPVVEALRAKYALAEAIDEE